MRVCLLSCVWLFVIPWTIAQESPLSMGFYRQEYLSELPFPPPEDLLIQKANPGLLLRLHWQAGSLPLSHLGIPLSHMKVKESEVAQSCPTLCDPMDCSLPGFSVRGIFPGKSTGVGCHFLLQGIFLTQGWNRGLLHCRQTLYPRSHQGSP